MSRIIVRHPAKGLLRAVGRSDVDSNPFVLGVTKPSAVNTGPVGTLAPYSGDFTVTAAGTVIQNLDIAGFVKVRAANVTVRNCVVRGSGPGTTNTGLIDCNHVAASNVLVENCLLVPDQPSYWLNAIIGHDYTIRRCQAYNVVDFCGAYNSATPTARADVVIEGNYFHDLAYFSPDPNHTDNRTHNDGVQIQGNFGHRIVGNTILANVSTKAGNGYPGASPAPTAADPYYPSVTGQAIGITPNVSQVGDVLIDSNWLDYGAQTITIIPGSQGVDAASVTIAKNRFGRNQPSISKGGVSAKRAILIDPAVGTITNVSNATAAAPTLANTYEDNGAAVTIYREVA